MLLACLAPLSLYAEDLVSCQKQKALSSKEGEKIQARLQQAYAGVTSIKAEFLQDSFLQALDISESSSGTVLFERPGKMRWDYAEPEKQQFLFADDTMWFYQEAQNQVLIDAANQVLLSELPIAFLIGIGDIKRDFTLVTACEREEGIVLELMPRKEEGVAGKQEGLKGFQLLIEPERALPIGARIVDVSGNITTVLLRALELNQKVDVATFAAKFPRGVDIQDRRKEKGSDI